MKEEVKETLKTLRDMVETLEECISSLQTAFIYNNLTPLSEVGEKLDTLKKQVVPITEKVIKLAKDNPHLRHYGPVPTHIMRIAENIERISETLSAKIREDVLFSDRAISEITFLFQRLIDITRPVSDLILAPNSIIGNYIRESEAGIVRRATDYATLHEERLIEGLCLPKASALYINILDNIKNIAWHCKEIANKLAP